MQQFISDVKQNSPNLLTRKLLRQVRRIQQQIAIFFALMAVLSV